jgi:hypothetical protein
MNLRSSPEHDHRDPAPSRRPSPEGDVRHGGRHFLSWTFFTLRHSLRPADPYSAADPSADAYRVRGLATPFATSTTGPPGTCVPERPWASPFKEFSSIAIDAPLGAHAFLTLPAAPSPPRGRASTTWPPSRPYSRDEFVLSPEPRVAPAVGPFLGFNLPESAPARPGARFDRGASPLALRRLDVQARPGLRVLRCERVERSVSGPPTLLGFFTFRLHGAPFAIHLGGLIALPHAATRRSEPPRSMPICNNATADPGPAARHRRHSVFDR